MHVKGVVARLWKLFKAGSCKLDSNSKPNPLITLILVLSPLGFEVVKLCAEAGSVLTQDSLVQIFMGINERVGEETEIHRETQSKH